MPAVPCHHGAVCHQTGFHSRAALTDAHAKSHVTMGLMAINLIVFLAMVFSGASPINPGGEALARFGGSWGYSLFAQQWRLLTANYVHAGIIHIAFNMWCLWDLGGLAERIFDRWFISCSTLVAGWLEAWPRHGGTRWRLPSGLQEQSSELPEH